MKKIRLTSICSPKQWRTIPTKDLLDEGYPVYGANGVIGYCKEYNHTSDTIIIGCRGSCGNVNIARGKSYINGNAMCLDDLSSDVDILYLYYFLQNYDFRSVISGTTIPQVTKQGLEKIDVVVSSKENQREIVRQLQLLDSIIEERHKELRYFDALIKSRFIEMFGDPKRNPRKWDMVTVGDIATDVRYGTSRPATEGGKYPYLRMNNLTYEGYLDLTDLKHIDIPDNEVEKCVVRNGDVLFNRTNSVELVGKTCVYNLDSDMIIAGYIIRVRIDDRVLPVILSSYLNSTVMKEQLRSMAKGAVNQANINAQELRSIPIYLPPITLQHEFATFVEQVDKSKFEIQQSLEKLEILKKSLMQQYFG